MMRKFSWIIVLLTLLLNISTINSTKATHLMGADLTWRCIGKDSFMIKMTKYRDCNGIPMGGGSIVFKCTSTGNTITTVSVSSSTGIDITPTCDASCTRCTDPTCSFPYGIERYVFTKLVVLSGAGSCCNITLSHLDLARNSSITTGAANEGFYVEGKLNRCQSPCDNSPTFTNPPIAIICIGQDFVFNQGVIDMDIDSIGSLSDSLVYQFAKPLLGAGSPTTWIATYSYQKPIYFWGFPNTKLPFPRGLHLDPLTGDLMFRPMKLEQTVMVILVKEYRNGKLIGEVRRDLQIIVINCPTNKPPILSGPYYKEVCAGSTVTFTINTNDYDPSDSLFISWNNSLPGAIWTDNNYKVKHPTGSLSWTPAENQASNIPYTFTVSVKDNSCPVSGSSTRAYQIRVKPLPRARIITVDSNCGDFWFFAQHISGGGATYMWQCNDPIEYFYSTGPSANHKFRSPGEFPYTMTMTAQQCSRTYFDTIIVDTFLNVFIPNDTDICINTYMNISAGYVYNTGPVSFQWNTSINDTLQSKALSIYQDTTLVLIARDTMGCSSDDTMHINMHNLPVVDVGADIRICNYSIASVDALVTFDESNIDTAIWLNAATGQVLSSGTSINISSSGYYVCMISDTIGCIGYDTLEIVESPEIIASASGHTICYGKSATLNALATGGGTANYYWYNSGNLVGAGKIIIVSPLLTTDYDLIVSETIDSVTCSDTNIIRVKVNPLPDIIINPIPERCIDGNTLKLNNYVNPPGGTWSSSSSELILPDNFIPVAVGTGAHWVFYEYTDVLTQCVNKDSTIVKINGLPNPSAGDDDSICSTSGLYDLYNKEFPQSPPGDWRGTAVGGNKYTWNFDPSNSAIVDGGEYNLIYKYTDANNCTNEDTVVITVFKTPVINAGNYDDVCINASFVKLTGTPPGGVWTGPGVAGDYFYPESADVGNHELTYTITNVICVLNNKTNIRVNPLPMVTAQTQSGFTHFCRTEGLIELNGQPSGSGGVWTGQGIQGNYFNTSIGSDVEESYTLNYEYTDENGCKNNEDLTVLVRPEPYIKIDPTADVLCFGKPYSINVRYNNAKGVLWYKDATKADGLFTGNVEDTTVSYQPGTADMARLFFWLNVKTTHDDNICPPAYDSMEVGMSDMPIPEFSADPREGCTPLTVQFTDSTTIGLGKLDKYFWNFGDGGESYEQNPEYQYKQSGTYTVTLTVTSNVGCKDFIRKVDYIVANIVPDVTFIPDPGLALVTTPTIDFENTTRFETAGIKYLWNFADYLVDGGGSSTEKNPSYKYSDTGHYKVQLHAINEFGCEDSFSRIVIIQPDVIVYIPNVFSPDRIGPETNNKFRVVTDGILEFKIEIFSRWGELLYESSNYEKHGWEGTYLRSNEECQVGAYIYIVMVKGINGLDYKFSGTVTLLK